MVKAKVLNFGFIEIISSRVPHPLYTTDIVSEEQADIVSKRQFS